MSMTQKYIFVSGGVCSSLGKGVAASTIGSLMEGYGYSIAMLKIDPYLNVDAGTMSPLQHGETYVTDDGAETDLDLGNYERFTEYTLSKDNSITTGQIYQEVISRERKGDYLGRCIQVIPHITDEIKKRIYKLANKNIDTVIVEIGGTVGDIEAWAFLEGIRQFINEVGKENAAVVHLTLLPNLWGGKELKTKLTQHSVQRLREAGLQPDLLLCRMEIPMPENIRKKISMFTSVKEEAVIEARNLSSIYKAPIEYNKMGLGKILLETLNLKSKKENFSKWIELSENIDSLKNEVNIGIVGKYTELEDSYKSIYESLLHAAYNNNLKVNILKIDSDNLSESNLKDSLSKLDGILVPGGFGSRGINGKVLAAQYARKNNIPFLGLCLGMQIMVIEFCKNVLKLKDANSEEFDERTSNPVVHLIKEQEYVTKKGGTMRLGRYVSKLVSGTKLKKIYNSKTLEERHRHRYEVNNTYIDRMENKGFVISCITEEGNLIEAMEWKDHKFGIGVQFHPEFKSKPFRPHPLFNSFIESSYNKKDKKV